MRSTPPAPAVFVDPTGRRRRFARRAAVLFAVPATGYVGLLVSTMVGGPSLDTPFIPVPDAVRPESRQHQVDQRTVPDGPSGTVGPGAAATPTDTPGASPLPTVTRPTGPPTTIPSTPQGQTPSPTPTQVPSTTPGRPTTLPTTPPTTAPSTPASKPGRTNSPTQRPTNTPRGPGST